MTHPNGPRRQRKLARLLERDGDRCHWCRRTFDREHPPTLEHLTPRHYGGTGDDSNVVLACDPCNSTRHHFVRCAACGNRVRRGGIWIDRREVFHATCLTRPGELLRAEPHPDRPIGSGVMSHRASTARLRIATGQVPTGRDGRGQ